MTHQRATQQRGGAGSRAAGFLRALGVLAVVTVGVPWALTNVARARFGGPGPFHDVPAPAEWDADRIRGALTDRLTEQTLADVVIRACLVAVWVALATLVLTVLAELVHMVRHDGLPLPHVRGLGWSQSGARVIAAGLFVAVPMLSSRAVARDDVGAAIGLRADPEQVAVADGPELARITPPPPSVPGGHPHRDREAEPGRYLVRAGDSIYGIAERFAGPDGVEDYADRLLDINLGRRMVDGQRFTNAAYIEVGWELDLPPARSGTGASAGHHLVERGESLWSIADDELGDPLRWRELFEANRDRIFDDGRTLDSPDLIHPGWVLEVPGRGEADVSGVDAVVDGVDEPGVDVSGDASGGDDTTPVPGTPVTGSPSTRSPVTGSPVTVEDVEPARPEKVWAGPLVADVGGADGDVTGAEPYQATSDARLLTLDRAAMLSAGVLALLAVRRRSWLRRVPPRVRLPETPAGPAAVERRLRSIDPGDRFLRVEIAVRAAATRLVDRNGRVVAVLVADDGTLELHAGGPVALDAPWIATDDPSVWILPGTTPVEMLAEDARRVGSPCPTLVQLGRTLDGRDVHVDLEALEAVEVGGPDDEAAAVVGAIAATLAGSVLAEVTTLVSVGLDDDAFLDHRLHLRCVDVDAALTAAAEAIGSTAAVARSTFELRARGTGGETWEPAVLLVGPSAGTVTPPVDRTGLAIVSASPVHGPSSRLAPDGDAWLLRPLGLRFVPIGLTAAETRDLAALVRSADAQPAGDDRLLDLAARRPVDLRFDNDHTLAPVDDEHIPVDDLLAPWSLLVRVLGPVSVESSDGRIASFQRSKSRELVAWLATHRDRSTRTAARTALWELDVRDATFANVVSEARRSLARLLDPPPDDEWIGRTMTESLPLHPLVRTDAELVRAALDASRLQPPDQAIATLTPAVESIVGLPFEGTSYLWPDAEGLTSQLVLLATSAAAELAAHHLSVGDVAGVLAATGRGLRVLPGHEELIGLRMQAHGRSGDHAAVRHEWEQYERVITADPWSDGEPAARLLELRRELLAR